MTGFQIATQKRMRLKSDRSGAILIVRKRTKGLSPPSTQWGACSAVRFSSLWSAYLFHDRARHRANRRWKRENMELCPKKRIAGSGLRSGNPLERSYPGLSNRRQCCNGGVQAGATKRSVWLARDSLNAVPEKIRTKFLSRNSRLSLDIENAGKRHIALSPAGDSRFVDLELSREIDKAKSFVLEKRR